jgi:hypothetical protein
MIAMDLKCRAPLQEVVAAVDTLRPCHPVLVQPKSQDAVALLLEMQQMTVALRL